VHSALTVLVVIIALLHVYFLVLEMFLWNTPFGHKTFKTTPEQATLSAPLAKNQGLYNGFLAAGLVWGLMAPGAEGFHVTHFFLICVLVAGVYGGITANRKIFFVQALPALIALALQLSLMH
jgi:putative membrane protein